MLRYIRSLLQYRELLYFLLLREIKARYKQTALGVSWAVIQPLSLMIVFTVVFSVLAGLPSDGAPYALFSYSALLPWQFFAGVLGRGVGSLVGNQTLVKKVYFPREIIPFAVVGSAMVDFAIGGIILLGLLWFYGVPGTILNLFIFPVLVVQVCFVVGLILILSPLNVFYRDIGLALPLLIQIWMFATPIIYPLSMVPEQLRIIYILNPMVGIVEGFRNILLHGNPPDVMSVSVAVVVSLATLTVGLIYFKRVEFKLADVI